MTDRKSIIYAPGLEPFEAPSEQDIVARKLDFLSGGGDFLYPRKGEDVGVSAPSHARKWRFKEAQ